MHDHKPSSDANGALVLCEQYDFQDGLLYLYEKMDLYVIECDDVSCIDIMRH